MSAELDLDDVAAQSELAKRELEALRRDAERYCWLRDVGDDTWSAFVTLPGVKSPIQIDQAIDAAINLASKRDLRHRVRKTK